MPFRNPNIALTKSITGSGSLGAAVRQVAQDALGLAGRARRVEHGRAERLVRDRVTRVIRDGGLVGLPAGGRSARPGHEQALELRALRRGRLGHLPPGGRAEQQPGTRVGDDVRDLVRRQVDIDQGVVQAGPLGAPLDLQQPGLFSMKTAMWSPAPQPGGPQEVRHLVAPRLVLGEGDGLAGRAHDDGGLVRVVHGMLACVHASPSARPGRLKLFIPLDGYGPPARSTSEKVHCRG